MAISIYIIDDSLFLGPNVGHEAQETRVERWVHALGDERGGIYAVIHTDSNDRFG